VDNSLANRFTYHAPKEGQPEKYAAIRAAALVFAELIASLTPASREQSLAFTHLDEAVMNANAALARHG
jgi:hypothetical protein